MIYVNYMSPCPELFSEHFDIEKVETVKEFGERHNKKSAFLGGSGGNGWMYDPCKCGSGAKYKFCCHRKKSNRR